MAALYVIRGKDVGRHFPLQNDCTGLGRDEGNELRLYDTEVSRNHAAIIRMGTGYEIKDLGSSNGTFVNSNKVVQQPLLNGDRLQVGRTLMIFTTGNEIPVVTAPEKTEPHGVDIVKQEGMSEVAQILHSIPSDPASVASSWSSVASLPSEENSSYISLTKGNWDVVYRTALAVSRTLDIDQLAAQILDLIFQSIRCDRGCILLMNEASRSMEPVCRKNRSHPQRTDRMEISKTILDYVVENCEGVYTSNAQEDGRWDPAASIMQMGIREAICVPMQGRYGLVGAIYIDTSTAPGMYVEQKNSRKFNEETLKLMVAIGSQAALAVEDTTYYRGMVQSEKLAVMGQTIATLSHHIKNILQGIRGGSFLVKDGLQKNDIDVIARGWRIVDRNQERIASLVMDMLTFSKDRVLERLPADPRITIDDVVELMQSRAQEVGVRLVWHRPEEFPLVDMDQESMHRAILNVLTNAIDAAQESQEGIVTLTLREVPEVGKVAIDIRDNGPGISEENRLKIFSLFESSKGGRGTGLGLPVSRKILQEHDGDIELQSHVGEGTCFSLIWPSRSVVTAIEAGGIPSRPTTF